MNIKRGRGASSNASGRFERLQYVPIEERDRVDTVVTPDASRSILATNDSPDVPFEQSINPYRGCEHGCIYCFARLTHAFLGLSPGLDFETRIFSKPLAPELLRNELATPGYEPQTIALGANTDPYQPAEKKHEITRRILEVLSEHEHPVGLVTKSDLVLRDLDILGEMAEKKLVHAFVSVTTLDPELARAMEPRASTPSNRLGALRELSRAGIPCGVLASPMIPALNDAELERILESASEAGARTAGYILLRLPLELKDLFREWLELHYPDKASHVLNLVRETRGGALYRSEFGERMRGTGPYADLLEKRFRVAARKYCMAEPLPSLDQTRFKRPRRSGEQIRLFE